MCADRYATDKPINFGVLVFPAFQALDVFGPLDVLNVVSRTNEMSLCTIAATLDPVSTQVPHDRQPSNSDFGQIIHPTHSIETAPPLDVLLVPGGLGTRLAGRESIVEFIKTSYPNLQYLITVCTGSKLAAEAGILNGRRATTNKLAWDEITAPLPEVNWVRKARWVQDGNIWTASGVSAGIDATLAWVGNVFGEDYAQSIADKMEYHRTKDPDDDPFAELLKS